MTTYEHSGAGVANSVTTHAHYLSARATVTQIRGLQVAILGEFAPSLSNRATVTQIRGLGVAILREFDPSLSARTTVTHSRGLVVYSTRPRLDLD